MLFEDEEGRLLMSDEVDELSPWEIEERKIHLFDDKERHLEKFPENLV